MKTVGVIMAGGGGTRFWPLSRKAVPKQLLNLTGRDFMVNEACKRLFTVAQKQDVLVITNELQSKKMREVTKDYLSQNQILIEPCARNTAACICYAAFKIIKQFGDAVMVVTPSDAYIKNEDEFSSVLKKAVDAASSSDVLVTIGITPTFAATGYGYIKYNKAESSCVKRVIEFKEKPDLNTARAYVQSGEYAWNSGMFIWKASAILKQFKEHLPKMYEAMEKFSLSIGTESEEDTLKKIYPELESISIDYGIMEKATNVFVVPGEFGWNDVGSFDTLGAIHPADTDGNVCIGDVLSIQTKNSVVYSNKRLVATIGLENIVVVETDDAVLVCSKDRVQDVKQIVEKLNSSGRKDLL